MNWLIIIFIMAVSILLILVISLQSRLRKLEDKMTDVTASDVAVYVEQMRELVKQSEMVADRLDSSIRERESALEDLSELVQSASMRLQDFTRAMERRG
ncbi:hypothetical protein RsTz2092_01980 [Deferribacterales bacterium RsTz2092]|nr:hypothetical protein AGMMS49941_02270 [Deferribacterales bacterium]